MVKKYFPLISVLLLLATLLSLWFLPSATPALGVAVLLFTPAASVSSIFEKHKDSKAPRSKIVKEIVGVVLTVLVVVTIGGAAGLFAGRYAGVYAESHWSGMGIMAGFVSAIATGFAVGYAVRRGMGKLNRR